MPHPETELGGPVCTHLRHLLWVLGLAQSLLIATLVVREEAAGLGVCSLQSPAWTTLQLLIKGRVHGPALDETHAVGATAVTV